MRENKKYAPRQIAKYVCDFFKGSFVIVGIGIFCFDGGKVLINDETDRERLSICREINSAIYSMTAHLRCTS